MQALTPWLIGGLLLLALYSALWLLQTLSWVARPSLRLQWSLRRNRSAYHHSQALRRRRR